MAITKKTKSVVSETVEAKKTGRSGSAYRVLVRPLVSEKAAHAEIKGVYTFVVTKDATKTQVMAAVEQVYGVRPAQVRTVNVEGKEVRFGRTVGRRKDWKKAIVTLPAGQTISIHTGV